MTTEADKSVRKDAHLSQLEFDTLAGDKVSLFGVFDGHGGAEVAQFTARHLPTFIRNLPQYKNGDFETALEDAFLQFDKYLTEPQVVAELKAIAGTVEESDVEEQVNEAIMLREEADMPINDLLAKYGTDGDEKVKAGTLSSVPSHLRQEVKPKSPFLRAKVQHNNAESTSSGTKSVDEVGVAAGMCSSSDDIQSSNKEPSSASSSSNGSSDRDIGSTSNGLSSEQKDGNLDSDISSSTSTGNRANKSNLDEPSGSPSPKIEENGITTSSDNNVTSPSSRIDAALPTQSNGDTKADGNDGDGNADSTNSADDSQTDNAASSTNQSEALMKPDKGKRRKITPTLISREIEYNKGEVEDGPAYEQFLKDFDASVEEEDEEEEDFEGSESDDEEDDEENESEESDEEDEEDSDEENQTNAIYGGDFDEPGKDSGCTAVVALLRGDKLFVANAGDSRCVVSRAGEAVEMSIDHKPEDDLERNRIEKAGGQVTADGRVNGGLNLSRAIGDHSYKLNESLTLKEQMISAQPDIKKLTITPQDEFMVLACDGIW